MSKRVKRKKPKYPRAGRYIKGGFARWSCYASWGQVIGIRLTLDQINHNIKWIDIEEAKDLYPSKEDYEQNIR